MDRSIVYTQEQGRSIDFLFAQRAAMIGVAKLSEAMLGTSTLVYGLGVTPTAPASLTVNVAAGQIYATEPVDATAYGVLSPDTTDQIVKQGLLMATQNLSCPAPTTAGYSINYLIQATYQDSDAVNVVLPYFNSANPSQPLSGQNNSGAAQPTQRQGVCVVAVKAGAAATTGSQTTPAPDSGYVGLAVVTVANGQTTITAGNIAAYSAVPQISNLLQMLQSGSPMLAADASAAANAYAITLTPPPTTLAPGMTVGIENFLHANTGASTLNVNGFGALPIQSAGGVALQGGEFAIGYGVVLRLNHAGSAWILIQSTGGPLPVPAGTQTQHAVNRGQSVGGTLSAYSNVSASRAIGTIYTNSTGRPLVVQVTIQTSATVGSGGRLLVAGSEISQFYAQAAAASNGNLAAIVPPGATYQVVNVAVGTISIVLWQEL